MKLRYGKGTGSVEVTGELKEMILKALRNTDQILLDAVEEELTKIEQDAKKNWPTRQKKYGKSKGSKDKFSTGFRIVPPSTIEGFIRNTAEYAYAIKAGADSTTTVKEGDRVVVELVFNPTDKAVERLVKKVADALMDKMR
jgi:hypothetical protein